MAAQYSLHDTPRDSTDFDTSFVYQNPYNTEVLINDGLENQTWFNKVSAPLDCYVRIAKLHQTKVDTHTSLYSVQTRGQSPERRGNPPI